jgi:hypothetical protein
MRSHPVLVHLVLDDVRGVGQKVLEPSLKGTTNPEVIQQPDVPLERHGDGTRRQMPSLVLSD